MLRMGTREKGTCRPQDERVGTTALEAFLSLRRIFRLPEQCRLMRIASDVRNARLRYLAAEILLRVERLVCTEVNTHEIFIWCRNDSSEFKNKKKRREFEEHAAKCLRIFANNVR